MKSNHGGYEVYFVLNYILTLGCEPCTKLPINLILHLLFCFVGTPGLMGHTVSKPLFIALVHFNTCQWNVDGCFPGCSQLFFPLPIVSPPQVRGLLLLQAY